MEKVEFNSDIFKENNCIYFSIGDFLGCGLYKSELKDITVNEISSKIEEFENEYYQEALTILIPMNVRLKLSIEYLYNKNDMSNVYTEFDILLKIIPRNTNILFYIPDDIKDKFYIPK